MAKTGRDNGDVAFVQADDPLNKSVGNEHVEEIPVVVGRGLSFDDAREKIGKLVSIAIQRVDTELENFKFTGDYSWFRWAKDNRLYHWYEFQEHYQHNAEYEWHAAERIVNADQAFRIPSFLQPQDLGSQRSAAGDPGIEDIWATQSQIPAGFGLASFLPSIDPHIDPLVAQSQDCTTKINNRRFGNGPMPSSIRSCWNVLLQLGFVL